MKIAKRAAPSAPLAAHYRVQDEDEKPVELTPAQKARRKAFAAEMRAKWAAMFAVSAGVDTPLADLDARACKGEHRDMIVKALDVRVAHLSADFKRDKPTLSERALAAMTAAKIAVGG